MKEILKEDKDLVLKRIEELKQDLRDLADEFRQTLGESSETWHDNSPWDNAKAKEAVMLAELDALGYIKRTYVVTKESEESPIGKFHEVIFNGNIIKVFLAGDYSPRAGKKVGDHIVVTKDSPVAQEILKL